MAPPSRAAKGGGVRARAVAAKTQRQQGDELDLAIRRVSTTNFALTRHDTHEGGGGCCAAIVHHTNKSRPVGVLLAKRGRTPTERRVTKDTPILQATC